MTIAVDIRKVREAGFLVGRTGGSRWSNPWFLEDLTRARAWFEGWTEGRKRWDREQQRSGAAGSVRGVACRTCGAPGSRPTSEIGPSVWSARMAG